MPNSDRMLPLRTRLSTESKAIMETTTIAAITVPGILPAVRGISAGAPALISACGGAYGFSAMPRNITRGAGAPPRARLAGAPPLAGMIKCQMMTATVNYEGIAIVKGVSAREEGAGVWIECEFPMPVGSRVEVQLDDGGSRPARAGSAAGRRHGARMGWRRHDDAFVHQRTRRANAARRQWRSRPPQET